MPNYLSLCDIELDLGRYDPSQAYRHNRAGEGVKAESERGSVEQSQTHINNVYPSQYRVYTSEDLN